MAYGRKRRGRVYRWLGVAIAAAVAAAAVWFIYLRDSAASYTQAGDRAMQNREYDVAHINYSRALDLDKENASIWFKDGLALKQMNREDLTLDGYFRSSWQRALVLDPANVSVLQALIAADLEVIEHNPRPSVGVYQLLHDHAQSLLTVNPNDLRAAAYVQMAPLEASIHGVSTSDVAINLAMQKLTSLMAKDPQNPDVPYCMARMLIRRADDYYRKSLTLDAQASFHAAQKVMEDAVKASPQSALMHFRHYQVLSQGDRLDPSATTAPTTLPATMGARYTPAMQAALQKARTLVAPTDAHFVEIYLASAALDLSRRGRGAAAAEAELRHAASQLPNNQRLRLALAEVVCREAARLEEGARLLRQPVSNDRDESGLLPGEPFNTLEVRTQIALANALIDRYQRVRDADLRQTLKQEIQDLFDQVSDKTAFVVAVLKLKGRIRMLEEGSAAIVQAIPIFQQALDELRRADPQARDDDLLFLLARAYDATGHTDKATRYLWEIVRGNAEIIPPRILLAQLLLAAHDLAATREQLDALRSLSPDDADVKQLWAVYCARAGEGPRVGAPNTPSGPVGQNPHDGPCAAELALFQQELSANHGREALAHLDNAEQIDPNNVNVLDLRFQIAMSRQDFTTAELYARRLGEKNVDQAHGLFYQYRLFMGRGNVARALEIAQKLSRDMPEFPRSWVALGRVHQAAGMYQPAVSDYNLALQKDPANFEALTGIIDCCAALNDGDGMRTHLETALKTYPREQQLVERLIEWQMTFGKPEEAVKIRLAAVQDHPEALDNWLKLASTCMRQAQVAIRKNQPPEARLALSHARDALGEAINRWPDELSLYSQLADWAVLSGDAAGGEQSLLAFAGRASQKQRPQSLVLLTRLYAHFNQFDKAQGALQEALNRSKSLPNVQQLLAEFQTASRMLLERKNAHQPVDGAFERQLGDVLKQSSSP